MRLGLLEAFRCRRRDVVSIGIAAVAADFTVDVSTALFSMFQFFEDDDAGAFAHDETVAVFIERTRSVSRVIVARAEGFHRRKAGNCTRRNGSFRTASKGCIEFAPLNHAVSVTDGVRYPLRRP